MALNAIPGVRAVRLDVTKPKEIESAVKTITEGGGGLYGLVNNAGIASAAPLLELSPEELDLTMSVMYTARIVRRAPLYRWSLPRRAASSISVRSEES